MTLPFSSFIYYMIVKKSDLHYAQEHIYLEKIAKFSDKNEIDIRITLLQIEKLI